MDVKFITVTREKFPTVPIIDGQVIAIYDEPGLYYDSNSTRFNITTTLFATSLEDVASPEENVLYAIYDKEDPSSDRGAYLYVEGNWICIAETYASFIGATQDSSGDSGLVPAPKIAERGKYLRGDGKWSYTPYPAWNRDYGEDDEDEPEGYDKVDDTITPDSTNPVTSASLYTEFRNKQDLHSCNIFTLQSANWNSTTYTQKLTINSETEDDVVLVSPADGSINTYINYGISCIEQGADYLIFSCNLLPTSDIDLNIAVFKYVDLESEESIDEETLVNARSLAGAGTILSTSSNDAGVVDPTITPDSKNPVMSSAIYAALLLKQNQHIQLVVTLAATSWDIETQQITVSVKGATDSNLVIVAPSLDSYQDYLTAGIKCIEQTGAKLTFDCATIPTKNITVNVAIFN